MFAPYKGQSCSSYWGLPETEVVTKQDGQERNRPGNTFWLLVKSKKEKKVKEGN